MATGTPHATVPLPDVMGVPISPDVVRFFHANLSKNRRQPYTVSRHTSHQTSTESWGIGHAVSCIPSVPGRGRHLTLQGNFTNMCRGGHMFAPTKTWHRWHRHVNLGQHRLSAASTLTASIIHSLVLACGHRVESISELPLVVSNSIESIYKIFAAVKALKWIGAYHDARNMHNQPFLGRRTEEGLMNVVEGGLVVSNWTGKREVDVKSPPWERLKEGRRWYWCRGCRAACC